MRFEAECPGLTEMNWALEHEDELRQRYGGQWIAVHNGRVVAYGPRLAEVMRQATEAGVAQPLVTSIWPAEMLFLCLGPSAILTP